MCISLKKNTSENGISIKYFYSETKEVEKKSEHGNKKDFYDAFMTQSEICDIFENYLL